MPAGIVIFIFHFDFCFVFAFAICSFSLIHSNDKDRNPCHIIIGFGLFFLLFFFALNFYFKGSEV